MIKPKVSGVYHISLDGGKTFTHTSKNLILDNYYNKTAFTSNMTLVIGSGSTPPELTNTSLEAQFGVSSNEVGFESTPDTVVFADRFEITYSRTFDLGTGYVNTIRELGVINQTLISRALFRAVDTSPSYVVLTATDHVVIRYSLIYTISRTPVTFNLIINGVSAIANVYAVNGEFGGWGTIQPGKVVSFASFGIATAGTWTLDANDNVIGPNITGGISAVTNINGISNITIVGTVNANTSQWNQTFQQILVTSSGANYITAPILINLDVPITKTANDILNISVSANQAAT